MLHRRHVLAGLAAGLIAVPVSPPVRAARILQTAPGKLSLVTLPGQTRCLLDTDTRLVCAPDSQYYRLERGQILFSAQGVAPARWLMAGRIRLHLQGRTSAMVRLEPSHVEVTAVTGRVEVHGPTAKEASPQSQWLSPGKRLCFYENGTCRSDQPDLDVLLSWQNRRLMFQNRPLSDVVAEINRYETRKITLSAGIMGNPRLSGVYYIGQADSFLRILPYLLPVRVTVLSQGTEITPA